MTRQKKSRKVGQIGIRKQETRPDEKNKQARRKKAPKGQKSGNRNSLIEDKVNQSTGANTATKKDPRVGSKKAISLVPNKEAQVKVEKPIQHSTSTPKVKLEKPKNETLPPDIELQNIEEDETLIALVERVEQGELLTGKEAKYFNRNMERHAELLEILGVSDKDEPEAADFDPLSELESDQWDDLLDSEK